MGGLGDQGGLVGMGWDGGGGGRGWWARIG